VIIAPRLAAALAVGSLAYGGVQAAELRVVSSNGVTGLLHELGLRFEQASGNTLLVHYDTTQALTNSINAGEDFDVAILTHPAAEALAISGKCSRGTDIARSGIGVAVRAGAAKPDVSSTAALKRALLAAKSVGFSSSGASGLYVEELLQRLGVAQRVNARAQRFPSEQLAARLAAGEVELVIQQISEIHVMQGAAYAGPLPAQLQHDTTFTASIAAHARDPAAAQALVAFLTAPAAAATIKANWMQPP
jgi:molybdate transport system substrate-binding protein